MNAPQAPAAPRGLTDAADATTAAVTATIDADDDLVETELLVEEISIDGMCGVY